MEALLAVWPVIVVLGGVAVWALRLESLVRINKNNLDHLEKRVARQESDIKAQLAKIDNRLENIATSLERVIWRVPRARDDDSRNN